MLLLLRRTVGGSGGEGQRGAWEDAVGWTSLGTATESDIICITAHEMVHVKQRVTGQWGQKRSGINSWYKKEVSPFTKYWDEPWEIDARAWERYIANRAIYEGIVTIE